MGEYPRAHAHVSQLAISETQKYGHVTYFWNGNRSGMFDDGTETYVEIPSDRVPFEQRPWMKAAEITDRADRGAAAPASTGSRASTTRTATWSATPARSTRPCIAVEAVDLAARAPGAGDRRSCRESWSLPPTTATPTRCSSATRTGASSATSTASPWSKTSHTLNPVPFYIYAPSVPELPSTSAWSRPSLANVAATVLQLLGSRAPSDFEPGLLKS